MYYVATTEDNCCVATDLGFGMPTIYYGSQ